MARPYRIEYPNAWYHVMNRGVAKKDIFHNSKHFQIFYDYLEEAHMKYGIEIHAYCLMNNHYHLLIKTPHSNISDAMRFINGSYAIKYNKLLKKDGPLFKGRFKAILVEPDNYLLALSRYIHLNPVTAYLVDKPEDYAWSSYGCYINRQPKPDWLYCDEILSRFNDNVKSYCKFVNQEVDAEIKNFYNQSRLFPILGTENFIERIKSEYVASDFQKQLPDEKRIFRKCMPSVLKIIETVARYYEINTKHIKLSSKRTKNNEPRNIAIYLAHKYSKFNRREISESFEGISYLSITSAARNLSGKITNNPTLSYDVNNIKKMLEL